MRSMAYVRHLLYLLGKFELVTFRIVQMMIGASDQWEAI